MFENANVSALVTADIRAFDEGDNVTPGSGKYISLFELDKPREKEHPHETYTHDFSPATEKELSLEFIQQDFHATDLLSVIPPTESKQELKDFAKSIRHMFVNKDTSGFMRVYHPKANALAYTHFKDRDDMSALVKMQMQEGMSKVRQIRHYAILQALATNSLSFR